MSFTKESRAAALHAARRSAYRIDKPRSRAQARLARFALFWKSLRRNPLTMLGLGIVGMLVAVAILGPVFSRYDPVSQDLAMRLMGPSANYWLGMIGLLVLYAKLGWIAGPGRIDILYDGTVPAVTHLLLVDSLLAGNFAAFSDACAHIALPSVILGYFSMAYIARMTRSFMIDQLNQDYIIAARAKGLSEGRVIWRHALGNAAVPLITVVALSYGSLLEGSVLTETVFAWPGLGLYLTNALLSADMNAVLGVTVVSGFVFLGLNLLSDMIYSQVDPPAK